MTRPASYYRSYYARTAPRRRKLANYRRQAQFWCRWLLANLEWPVEADYSVPPIKHRARPILRLAKYRLGAT